MAKIENISEDWQKHSGAEVQEFIKEQIRQLSTSIGSKFGDVTYEGGRINFYAEDGGTLLQSIILSGTVYSLQLATDTPSVFYVLTTQLTKKLVFTPTTKSGSIGGNMDEFAEDYTWIMAIDNGNGFSNVQEGTCGNGQSFTVDVRAYVKVGTNRIRITVTGTESEQAKSLVFTCNVTSMTMTCEHTWQTAWIEGKKYGINGIFFSGNLQKTLYVRLDDDDSLIYTQDFSASTSYATTAYTFDMTNRFPASSQSGVHKVEVWMAGGGIETEHYVYNIMCVKADEEVTAKLVCINEISSKAINYDTQDLFKFATYGATRVTVNITGHDSGHTFDVVTEQSQTVQTEIKNTYGVKLEMDTEQLDGVYLDVSVAVDGCTQNITMAVDNSNSYAATQGYSFYLNASTRTNDATTRETIINTASDTATNYDAEWSGFAWSSDGWATDDKGVKCLSVQAGSTVTVPTLLPLSILPLGRSLSIEWKMKASHVADYETPIMTIMDTESVGTSTNGIIVYPTRVTVLATTNRNTVAQTVELVEDEQLHIVIVFQRGYSTTGRNLCRIYINGVQQCVFEYAGSADFGNGCLKLGQQASDLYLYMMRIYRDKVLEPQNVLANWLNVLTDSSEYSRVGLRHDNNIIDGNELSYDMVKAAGFNTMVVQIDGDQPIPSLAQTSGKNSTLWMEFADNPEWNFQIENAPVGGQGTTSMKYYRWNLRWKLAKQALNSDGSIKTKASVWTYADGSQSATKGFFDGKNNHPKVNKITAKKNVASSGQGHKMGATAMYHEIYAELGLNKDLPSDARLAVYQYPVIGFQKMEDGTYKYIGLYTIGPDKGDKGTFGYDASVYPDMLSIEGPNHAPLGTRFLHPWTDDCEYSMEDETLKFGGEEGWDVDVYDDDNITTADGLLQLLAQEWKPAYDVVYYCSPYLRKLSEVGYNSLDELNANIMSFRNDMSVLGNRKNEVLTLYDDDYNLIYYRNKTGKYEVLSTFNMLDYLTYYLSGVTKPTTEQLIAARKAKFKAEAGKFWDLDSCAYHACFCFLIGASDNDAKNSYPFKLKKLTDGGRWGWREDDLDTILPTDNNGNSTKKYSVEPGDLSSDTDIFQGSSSVLWTLMRDEDCLGMKVKAMMADIFSALVTMASRLRLESDYMWRAAYNMFDYYFWRRSARYLPCLAYNEDAVFAYIYVWSINPTATYNGVPPLSQALGTQYEAEKQWVIRRIIYTMSKFEIGGFKGSSADGLNTLEFTPAESFDFKLVPAIDLYPSGNKGGGDNLHGARTDAGKECTITANSDGSTTFYIKALDWLNSLGDLSSLKLTSRGGVETITFNIQSSRLRTVKVGDENAGNVRFNATALSVQGESIEEIDARNVSTLVDEVKLLNCPRLKRALFSGTNIPSLLLPSGAKVEEVSFSDGLQTLFIHSLPLLTDDNLTIPDAALKTIANIYYYDSLINPFDLLRKVYATEGNRLRFITMVWNTPIEGTAADLTMLSALSQGYDEVTGKGYGRVLYDSEKSVISTSGDQLPNLQGTITIDGYAFQDDAEKLRGNFPSLELIVSKGYYFRFKDAAINQKMAENFGDGMGMTIQQVEECTSLNSLFSNNTDIVDFSDFAKLKNVKELSRVEFQKCSSLEVIDLGNITKIVGSAAGSAFYLCISLTTVLNYNMQELTYGVFLSCTALTEISLPNVVRIYAGALQGCNSLKIVHCPNLQYIEDQNSGRGAFKESRVLTSVNLEKVIKIGKEAFNGCWEIKSVVLPEIEIINNMAFESCSITKAYIGEKCTVMEQHCFYRMLNQLERVFIVTPITPPTAGADMFDYTADRRLKIYVPDDSVDAYKTATNWTKWADNIKPLSEYDGEEFWNVQDRNPRIGSDD